MNKFDLALPSVIAGDDKEKLNQLLSEEFQKLTADELAERLVGIQYHRPTKTYVIRLKA